MKAISAKLFNLLVLLAFAIGNFQIVLSGIPEDVKREGNFKVDRGKALNDHVVATHHVTEPLDCIFLCVANTQCLSINYKPSGSGDKDVCELTNATRISDSASYKNDSRSDHYYDMEIEESRSCLDYLRRGSTKNGIYTITDGSGDSYKVWCDLSSEPGSAWTLMMSYAYKNRNMDAFCKNSFTEDVQVNEDTPNWEAYRLSRNRMKLFANQSTHLRVTSSANEYGIDYRDYLRVNLSTFDILNFLGREVCKNVEYVNIRGIKAVSITVPFWQLLQSNALHTDSGSSACEYDARQGAVSSENDFGFLCEDGNPAFRAAEHADSTTDYWFGGYL